MAVDRWGKDGKAANVALRGLVTDAKAAFAALWGDRVKKLGTRGLCSHSVIRVPIVRHGSRLVELWICNTDYGFEYRRSDL